MEDPRLQEPGGVLPRARNGVVELAGEVVAGHRSESEHIGLFRWIYTTNHHDIGILYIATAFLFFLLAGVLALIMRAELAYPGETVVNAKTYSALFTMHGTSMIFLVAIPLLVGFANLMVPPLIGADDMIFPRLNALTYWLIPGAGVILWLGSAEIGWTGYAPLSVFEKGLGVDLWIVGLQLLGISSTAGAINIIVTILRLRAPGITFNNLSLFVWSVLVTMGIVMLATPVLAAGLFILLLERHGMVTFFQPAAGGDPLIWQHVFWFYSHPAVYIMILPVMGVISEVIPRFSGKPIFGYKAIALSSVAIGFMGFGVWAHHMFTTGMSLSARIPFMVLTLAIAVPSGIKVFNWIMTMWGGVLDLRTPMLFAIGFISMFVIGGINGVFQAPIPVDYQLQDTYWVVAHLHYVLFGGTILGAFAGLYFYFPRMTRRMYSERLGRWHFAVTIVSMNVVFFTQHFVGLLGMPRRVADYDPDLWSLNWISSVGAFVLGFGQLLFVVNVVKSYFWGPHSEKDPWPVVAPPGVHVPTVGMPAVAADGNGPTSRGAPPRVP